MSRLGPGPVFVFEWLMATRRWQMYALRSLFVAALLCALGLVWWMESEHEARLGKGYLAHIGEQMYYAIIGTQLTMVLLVAPAASAGAICLDKTRGALVHLFVTDLSNSEIILGKLFARLAPVLGLLFCSLPVLCLASFLGGIDLSALIGSYVVTIGVAVLCCVLALALSVWGSKTHEVLMVTYAIIILALLITPIWEILHHVTSLTSVPDWLVRSNPYWLAFAPYSRPGSTEWLDYFVFLGVCLCASLILIVLSIGCVRRAAAWQAGRGTPTRKQKESGQNERRRRWFGPSLDGNPVLWLEWHRKRSARGMRAVWQLYAVIGTLLSLVAVYQVLQSPGTVRSSFIPFLNGFLVAIGLLLIGVAAVTALAEERNHGSLDVLLTTPLSTSSIVWGKWWGCYRTVPLLAILPAMTTILVAFGEDRLGEWIILSGMILAYGAITTSVGLALATWIVRLGWALTVAIALAVFVNVGWLFLVVAASRNSTADGWGPGLAAAGPWFGTAFSTIMICERHSFLDRMHFDVWQVVWILGYSGAALVLLQAIIRTFDRCMGRSTGNYDRGGRDKRRASRIAESDPHTEPVTNA